jgi:hypothetical protein
MNNRYHFITHWEVQGNCEGVYDLLRDPLCYPRWWPRVYLNVEKLQTGDENGLGQRVRFLTKGWLPYTLRWESLIIEAERPRKFAIQAFGDFDGRGIWTLEERGDAANVLFDWKLNAEKPLLKYLSFLFKPVFSANHRWAMEQGRRGLQMEVRQHTRATL